MKTKTCKCEHLKVIFKDKTTVHIQGGWLYGSPHTHAVCKECGHKIRIAYSVVHLDSEGKPFHPKSAKKQRKMSGKSSRKRTGKRHTGRVEGKVWRFVD